MVEVWTLLLKNSCGAKLKIGKNTQKYGESILMLWEDLKKRLKKLFGGQQKNCSVTSDENSVTSDT